MENVNFAIGLGFALHWGTAMSQAISVPPSLLWEGLDGSWSTFAVRIGSPEPQVVRLLPGTSANAGSSIWVVLPEGCTVAAPNVTNCAEDRGGIFFRNESSTWSTERLANGGLFSLATFEESKLGLGGNAYYGFDQIQLGYNGFDSSALDGQLVAGIAGYDWWLGSLGLSPIPFNFSEFGDPVPSYLRTLRDRQIIGSTSWAYTAGASYHDPPVFGSLTLGGHDRLRFDEHAALKGVAFGADSSRDLLIGLKSISHDTFGSDPLLSKGIYAFIDSMVTDLWLPLETCLAFEQAFNLTWNASDETYWVDEAVHNQLVQQSPTLTFTLGVSSESGGDIVDVVLPYAAFDLMKQPPIVQTSTHYFPLKRAANSTQYTLGRVFLQELYVIADYDRATFTVAQALFPTPASEADIAENRPNSSPSASPDDAGGDGDNILDKGAIAGIAVAACVVLALLAGAGLFHCRKRRSKAGTKDAGQDEGVVVVDEVAAKVDVAVGSRPELDFSSSSINELDARGRDRPELPGALGSYRTSEIEDSQQSRWKKHARESPAELAGGRDGPRVFELDAR